MSPTGCFCRRESVVGEQFQHLASPLSPQPSMSPSMTTLTVRKKALLIAIAKTKGYPDLGAAHKDVHDMRELLMSDRFGYMADDITTLIDDGVAGHVQPTRKNILTAIATFVADVKEGDRLFFHYCGHSTQVVNPRSDTQEEDGKDECLVPLDGDDMKIVDNDLHDALVVPLPAGSSLVAVLDTCHSGSLLDLKHYRCNRVAVPWLFRGKRDSEEIRNKVVRRGAQLITLTEQQTHKTGPSRFLSRHRKLSVMCDLQEVPASIPRQTSVSMRDRSGSAASRVTSRLSSLTRTQSPPRLGKENVRPVLSPLSIVKWILPEEEVHCQSPVGKFACNGWCRRLGGQETFSEHHDEDDVKADVISLASCKDSQQAWDDGNGMSMTSMLIEYLKENTNPTLKELLVHLSHATHSMALTRHNNARTYKRQVKNFTMQITNKLSRLQKRSAPTAAADPQKGAEATLLQPAQMRGGRKRSLTPQVAKLKQLLDTARSDYDAAHVDMDSFQNPELASVRPLDMERRWIM